MHGLLLPLLLSIGATADTPANPDTSANADIAVVCPAEFRTAMQPWLARRRQQGHAIEFISSAGNALQVRERIRALAKNDKLHFVLLVGDPTPPNADATDRARCTPTFYVPAQVTCYWGSESEIATDNPYADLDDDRIPDLAVGRLTARTPEALSVEIKKILASEDCRDFGPWRARINFVTGQGLFGDTIDAAVDELARRAISCEIPAAYQSTITSAVWRSPFCPDPHAFHSSCLQRLDEGCLFWVFMGHGAPRTLQWAEFPNGATPILRCEDCANLHSDKPGPIAMLMCCYTGHFGQRDDCLAEELLRTPSGPVAVFGGSNETMPYGMTAMGGPAISEFFENRCPTLGDWILQTKRHAVAGYNLPIWSLLHALTVAIAPPGVDLKEERFEHLQLFNLFGDPTMPLVHPRDAQLSAPTIAVSGQTITIHGRSAISGQATVELLRSLNPPNLPLRRVYDDSPQGRKQFSTAYNAANNRTLASISAEVHEGEFSIQLSLPTDATGDFFLRAFVEGKDAFALGSARLQIRAPAAGCDRSSDVSFAGK